MNLYASSELRVVEINEFRMQHEPIANGAILIERVADDGVSQLLTVHPQLV